MCRREESKREIVVGDEELIPCAQDFFLDVMVTMAALFTFFFLFFFFHNQRTRSKELALGERLLSTLWRAFFPYIEDDWLSKKGLRDITVF